MNTASEYKVVREEINQKIELHNNLMIFAITTVVAILSFILTRDELYSSFLFLIPFCVLIPITTRIAYYRSAIAKLSAYIMVFLEPCMPDMNWETRNSHLSGLLDKSIKTTKSRKEKSITTWILKGYWKYSELPLLGFVCYVLFIYDYLNGNQLNTVTIINLSWPFFLVVLETFIVSQDSIEKSRKFWIEHWKKIKYAEMMVDGSQNYKRHKHRPLLF